MSRPSLLEPGGGYTTDVVTDALALVGIKIPCHVVSRWAPLELAVVYDWVMREHLSASDSPVRRRPKPRLLELCT